MISCAMSIFHVYLIWHHSQNISTQFAFGTSFTTLCKISANTLTCMIEAWHFMCGSVKLVSYEIMSKHHWGFYYAEQCIREIHKNRGTFKGIVEYQVALLFPLNLFVISLYKVLTTICASIHQHHDIHQNWTWILWVFMINLTTNSYQWCTISVGH